MEQTIIITKFAASVAERGKGEQKGRTLYGVNYDVEVSPGPVAGFSGHTWVWAKGVRDAKVSLMEYLKERAAFGAYS